MPHDPATDPSVDPARLSEEDWRIVLRPLEFEILRHAATERPGTGRYLDEERPGTYCCAGCGQRLYAAAHKFHSGCGWPSFFQQIEPGAITTCTDTTHGMIRTEMRCSRCDGHLGHVFDDAPHTPTGKRHCVNGFSLVFVPEGEEPEEILRRHRG